MAEITTAFFMPFKYPLTSYTILAVDVLGTNTRTVGGLLNWNIIEFAVNPSPTGGLISDPINLLKTIETALNAGGGQYRVSLGSDGLVKFINLNLVNPFSITFSSTDLAYSLGFTSVGPFAAGPGATVSAEYQPTHAFYSFAREEDMGWQSKGQIFAVADLPDGTVYGWGNGQARFIRRANFKYHPKDVNDVTGILSNITPAYPSIVYNPTQWKSPSNVPTLRPPWTAHNFLNSAIKNGQGSIIMACFGNFQTNIAGTDLKVEQVTLNAESIRAEHFSLSMPNYDKYRNIDNMTFNFFNHKTRDIS